MNVVVCCFRNSEWRPAIGSDFHVLCGLLCRPGVQSFLCAERSRADIPSVIGVCSYAGRLRSLWFQAGSDAKSRTPRRRSTCLSLHKSIGLHACFTSVFNSSNLPCILRWFEKETHQLVSHFLPVEVTDITEYLYSVLSCSLPDCTTCCKECSELGY